MFIEYNILNTVPTAVVTVQKEATMFPQLQKTGRNQVMTNDMECHEWDGGSWMKHGFLSEEIQSRHH